MIKSIFKTFISRFFQLSTAALLNTTYSNILITILWASQNSYSTISFTCLVQKGWWGDLWLGLTFLRDSACVGGGLFVYKVCWFKINSDFFPSCWKYNFLKNFSYTLSIACWLQVFCILTRPWSTRKNAIWQGLFKRLEKAMKASAVSKFKINTAAMNDMPCTWRKEKCYPLAITVLYCLILSLCSLVFDALTELLHLEKCLIKQDFLTHVPLDITSSVHGS